jgi:hypothetical protein
MGAISGTVVSLQQVQAAEHEARRRAEEAIKSYALTN